MLPPGVGYNLTIEEGTLSSTISVSNSSRPSLDDSSTSTHSTRLLVGYSSTMPVQGRVSRAQLNYILKKITSEFIYFGGFVGQGNISSVMILPADAEPIKGYMEVNVDDSFHLYVNNYDCGIFSPVFINPMEATVNDVLSADCLSHLTKGESNPSTFQFKFTGNNLSKQYIGGGFIEVQYSTEELDTDKETGNMRFYFPEINGVINYYDSFFVPGPVSEMSLHIKFLNNFTNFTIWDTHIFSAGVSPSVQTIVNDSSQIFAVLASSQVNEQTVPIRLQTTNISQLVKTGNAT
jgi:hypothetical protein